jgi:hypothetical protein
MRNNEELKLLLESIIPDNIKSNHALFYKMFEIFFEYIADAYMLGANPNLLIEPNEDMWESKFSSLYHTDLKEIKKELIKTYLYDYHKFIEAMENDPEIYDYFKDVYNNTVNEHLIDIDTFVSRIDSDEFLSHKKVSQQKTIPILFNYLMAFFKKMNIPNIHGVDTFLEMYQGSSMNPKKPFSYTINSSIPKPVYEKAIHNRIHPVGFNSEFKYESAWTLQDFVNLRIYNEDWKVYTITTEKENDYFDYKIKTKKLPECSLTYRGDELLSQFDVNYKNTLSLYGKNITEATAIGDGKNLVRVSENEYKLLIDTPTIHDSAFNGVKLVEPDINGGYSTYDEEDFIEDNNLSAHGGMIATDGSILIDGQTVPGYKVVQNVLLVEKTTDTGTYWEADNSFEVVDGFVFKISVKDLYTQQAARFDERSDFIKVYDHTEDVEIFSTVNAHSFFITLLNLTEPNYIFSTNDRGGAITHSLTISKDRLTIYERGGYVLEAFKQFTTNQPYHIVVQWDSNGRRIYVDNEELFVTNKARFYPEKIYFKTIKNDWDLDSSLNVTFSYKEYSVTYNRAYEYDKSITVPYKVSFVKSGNILNGTTQVKTDYVLLESLSEYNDIYDLRKKLADNRDLITQQKAEILRQFAINAQSMTAVQSQMELNRINEMFSSFDELSSNNDKFSVTFIDEDVLFSDITVEKDEFKIKSFFDNILDINNAVFNEYSITPDDSTFLYRPEINQIIIGNTLFHYTQGLCRVNYIIDNYDIYSRPLTVNEIDKLYTNHDLYLSSGDLPDDIELRWNLDNAIWDSYHSEMDFHKPKLWDISNTYSIGMENLLIKWYIASNYKGATFDCSIDKYIDHPKALIDWTIMYNPETVEWTNVENVTETIDADNNLFIVAELKDGTRLEYVKNKYLKHVKRYISDRDGNVYDLDIPLTRKAILETESDYRAYGLKEVKYIPITDFNTFAVKTIVRMPEFEGVTDYNNKLNAVKIDVARPLVQMKGVYIMQDPALVSNPETLEIVVKGISSYEYQKNQLEDFEGRTVYDSYISLEFLSNYDDPYIKTFRWDESESSLTFEEALATIDTEDNYIILTNEYVFIILDDGFKQILTDVEIQDLRSDTILLNENGVEVFYDEDIIKQYPSTSFMDYSYKIRIEALGSDDSEYVVEIELGDEYMPDAKYQEEIVPKLCTRVTDGKIYLNMDTRATIANWPLVRHYDYVYTMDEEYEMLLEGNGIGGVLESLVKLGFLIADISKTVDLTMWKITTSDNSRKIDVINNKFTDFDGAFIAMDASKMYVGIPDDPQNEAILNRYPVSVKDQLNYYYMSPINERIYIDEDEFPEIKTLWQLDSSGNILKDSNGKPIPVLTSAGQIKRFYDVPKYTRHEVLIQEITVPTAPTFVGYVNNMSVSQLQHEMSVENNYILDEPVFEVEITDFVSVIEPGYWINSDGFKVDVVPSKEFVYYYDGIYKVPANLDMSLRDSNTLYIWVGGYRETITKATNGDMYYISTGSGATVYVTAVDLVDIFYYVPKVSGGSIPVPYNPAQVTSSTVWYLEAGGNRIWRENAILEDRMFYYDNGTETPLSDIQLPQVYTMGGIGIKDMQTRYLVNTPSKDNWFYFSSNLWNHVTGEHYRIYLTPYEVNLVQPDGKATLSISDEAGNITERVVQCYVPKNYVDSYNSIVTIKETEYKLIEKQYDGQEFITITTQVSVAQEEYIKVPETIKYEVLSRTTNAHFIDENGIAVSLINRLDETYFDPTSNKYYVNIPYIRHKRIYADENNQWVYYYFEGTDKRYIDKWNFEWYSKSFLSNATKFIDIPYKEEKQTFEEVRQLRFFVNSLGTTKWLDKSGYEFLSAKEGRYMYMTGDGRLYPTSYDNLGRYYRDEGDNTIYIEKFNEYMLNNNVWWHIEYEGDNTYVSREGMFNYRQNEIAALDCTRTSNTLFHSAL